VKTRQRKEEKGGEQNRKRKKKRVKEIKRGERLLLCPTVKKEIC
jgi:hypothetical protein